MSEASPTVRFWAVVPAAGAGRRMNADRPKQYLPLRGSTVLERTLRRLGSHPGISGTVVAIAPEDGYWPEIAPTLAQPRLLVATGGAERCHSVLNALERLAERAADADWVLVHDAARPCLRLSDIDRLIALLSDHPVGGLLALPVTDTVKRAAPDGSVIETVEREGLWRAMTPQMFRLAPLREALRSALRRGEVVTDEAAAMERAGQTPRVVEGQADNIKITRPGDLALAELYLDLQAREAEEEAAKSKGDG